MKPAFPTTHSVIYTGLTVVVVIWVIVTVVPALAGVLTFGEGVTGITHPSPLGIAKPHWSYPCVTVAVEAVAATVTLTVRVVMDGGGAGGAAGGGGGAGGAVVLGLGGGGGAEGGGGGGGGALVAGGGGGGVEVLGLEGGGGGGALVAAGGGGAEVLGLGGGEGGGGGGGGVLVVGLGGGGAEVVAGTPFPSSSIVTRMIIGLEVTSAFLGVTGVTSTSSHSSSLPGLLDTRSKSCMLGAAGSYRPGSELLVPSSHHLVRRLEMVTGIGPAEHEEMRRKRASDRLYNLIFLVIGR
ncbi:hypothetical protein BDV59DRAFT_108298 [Aspergillus ambiguus]|uniref:uncharacterized protein n=1 Tax=Aspergillus ambiguus TaxID=176160 RepID=UPI003CCD0FE6